MVGGTAHQPPQLAPPSSSSSSTAPATSPEEDELVKRNTDCVYFLASPLTCKKGSECEYRHSDIARMNPRDCWYWLNGNCLNPKCGFRHPPLDVSTPMAPSVPQLHTPVTPKQGVTCIFFQKGFCLKGHLCPFLHTPPTSLNISKTVNPLTDPPKKAYSHPENPSFTQQETIKKPVEFLLPHVKQARNSDPIDKKLAPPSRMASMDPSRQKPLPVKSEMTLKKANHVVHKATHVLDTNRIMSFKNTNEYSRETSPGFDILVKNEVEESEYHHDKDDSRRPRDTYRSRSDNNESDLRHHLAKQRRVSHNDASHVSSRLRGRIKIPRRSKSPSGHSSFNQSRLKDRLLGRVSENKNNKGSHGRQTFVYDDVPKRLVSEEKRKHPQSADDLSFEGPKPLSEILKRKRGSFDDNHKETDTICGKKVEYKSVSASEVEKESEQEVEDEEGLIDEDAMLDQELEAYDYKDGDYDYEQIDGQDYNLDEGEIPDEDYVDEDGEFVTKESVPY